MKMKITVDADNDRMIMTALGDFISKEINIDLKL